MSFKNVRDFNNEGITNVVETNLSYWLSDGFTRIGSYSRHQSVELQPDKSGLDGQEYRWQSPIKNWGWQVLNGFGDVIWSPAVISIVPIGQPNDSGVPITNTVIDYLHGEVTVGSVIDPSAYKVVASFIANDVSIVSSIQTNRRPMVVLDPFGKDTSDYITVFEKMAAEYKIQTPFILIKVSPTGTASPLMIGSGQVWVEQRIKLDIVTETEHLLNKILGILTSQSYRTIPMFNSNIASTDGALPLDENGDINPSPNACLYHDLLYRYYIDSMYWDKWAVRKFNTNRQDIHLGMAWLTVKIISNPNY